MQRRFCRRLVIIYDAGHINASNLSPEITLSSEVSSFPSPQRGGRDCEMRRCKLGELEMMFAIYL
jgi:hypothetical protein